jgi:hypothetical protein
MQAPKPAPDRKDPAPTPSSPELCLLRAESTKSDRLIVELADTGSTPDVILIRRS